jgi:hypothetical protein
MRGQASLEFAVILTISVLLLLLNILVLANGLTFIKPTVGAAQFANFWDTLFSTADSVSPGSQRVVTVTIPHGVGNLAKTNYALGWSTYELTYSNHTFRRIVPYNLTFIPENLTAYEGTITLKIYSDEPGVVIVEKT